MDIDLQELAAVLPKLSLTAQQEIHIRILEARLEQADVEKAELQHHIEALQTAVKESR